MTERAKRIERDIEAIGSFSESPTSGGHNRPTFSAAWARAREYVLEQASDCGAVWRTDAAGNLHIRHAAHGWSKCVWLSGSHIDSVPSGGKYDGVMGVVVPLELIRSRPELPLELIVFAEEEGTTFGLGMLGSRGWTGELSAAQLGEVVNASGRSFLSAGAPYGVDPVRLGTASERLDAGAYLGFVEVHAEQGPGLWDADKRVAVVDLIAGRRQYEITLEGQENHAGSTVMAGRRDALVGASAFVTQVESIALELDRTTPRTVMTVGSLGVTPGALNVVPGKVVLTVDFRSRESRVLDEGDARLREALDRIATARHLRFTVNESERIEPQPLSAEVCSRLQTAAGELGEQVDVVSSGALHDAAIIAPWLPTAMVFVASRDGISHNPREFSRIEDIELATRILERTIEGSAE